MASHALHRYYEREFPNPGETVVVKISKIDTMGVYCTLIEYGDKVGYIPIPELSQVKIRRIQQTTKLGNEEVVIVTAVDAAKGFVLPLPLFNCFYFVGNIDL